MLNDFALMFQNKPVFHTPKAKVLSDGGFGCSLISVFLVTNKLCDCLVFNDFHSKKDITFRQINVQNMIKRKKGGPSVDGKCLGDESTSLAMMPKKICPD